MFKRIVLLNLAAWLFFSGVSVGDDFYYGAHANRGRRMDNMTGAELDSLKRYLGFNLLNFTSATSSQLAVMADSGFMTVPGMGRAGGQAQAEYTNYLYAHYAKVEAEDDVHEIRFTENTGYPSGGFVYGPRDDFGEEAVFLEGLWYKHGNNRDYDGQFYYWLRIDIDSVESISHDETVGYLRIYTGPDYTDPDQELKHTFEIKYDTSVTYPDTVLSGQIYPPRLDYIEISTLQKCKFGVDFFKVHNLHGSRMVEQNLDMDNIVQYASDNSGSGNVLYWYMRDEPTFTQWAPYAKIDSALEACGSCSPPVSVFSVSLDHSPRDFISRANPNLLFADSYPLAGGQTWTMTTYYNNGNPPDVENGQYRWTRYTGNHGLPGGTDRGLQYDLNNIYLKAIDSVHTAVGDSVEMWVLTQSYGDRQLDYTLTSGFDDETIDSIAYDFSENNWSYYRPPTRSELSALTFISMCYDLKGLVYYRYDSYYEPTTTTHSYNRGITDTLWDGSYYDREYQPTELWTYLEESVAPYVKAFGEIFVSLDYDTSYSVNPSTDPPSSAAVASAYASSEIPHPDTGWLHIGEFNDNDTLYVMLVNRACSKGVNDSTPAPPQHVRLDLKPSAVGSNYAYIINLADTAYYDTSTSTWVSLEDTTYSANLGGTIPFTTVLGPGEGRLFKIVGTVQQ